MLFVLQFKGLPGLYSAQSEREKESGRGMGRKREGGERKKKREEREKKREGEKKKREESGCISKLSKRKPREKEIMTRN